MRPLRSIAFLALLSMVQSTAQHTAIKCCPGEHYFSRGMCTDGSAIKISKECKSRAVLDPENYPEYDMFEINEDSSLILLNYSVSYSPGKYCLGKFNTSSENVAVICADSEEPWYELRAVCGFLSVIFLLITIIVYLMVPTLRDLQGKCILHSLFGLTSAFFSLAFIQISTILSPELCVFTAFVLYITFMISFSWLNVVAFNVWRITVTPNFFKKTDRTWHIIYCIYAYSIAISLALIAVITHTTKGEHIKPGFGEGSCFFNGSRATWVYFYVPTTILLAINLILFIWTSVKLWFDHTQLNTSKLRNLKYRFLLTMKLFLIMGLFWMFEVISYASQNSNTFLDYVWIITDYLNSLQGLLIFLVLVVFRKKALRGLANHWCIGSKLPRSWTTLRDEECSEEERENKDIRNTTGTEFIISDSAPHRN